MNEIARIVMFGLVIATTLSPFASAGVTDVAVEACKSAGDANKACTGAESAWYQYGHNQCTNQEGFINSQPIIIVGDGNKVEICGGQNQNQSSDGGSAQYA